MPHGTPDWGLVGPKETTYGLDDLGEHAVRLGSPHLWDRRGDAIWLTVFEEGMGGVVSDSFGGGDAVALHTSFGRQGAYEVRLLAGSGDPGYARLWKDFPLPVSSGYGGEVSFSRDPWTLYLEIMLRYHDGARIWEGRLQYRAQTQNLEYVDALNAPVVIADVAGMASGPNVQHTMKLVVDRTTNQYVRAILNEQTFSLLGIGLRDTGPTAMRYLRFYVEHRSVPTHNPYAYIDSLIVTQNEP